MASSFGHWSFSGDSSSWKSQAAASCHFLDLHISILWLSALFPIALDLRATRHNLKAKLAQSSEKVLHTSGHHLSRPFAGEMRIGACGFRTESKAALTQGAQCDISFKKRLTVYVATKLSTEPAKPPMVDDFGDVSCSAHGLRARASGFPLAELRPEDAPFTAT